MEGLKRSKSEELTQIISSVARFRESLPSIKEEERCSSSKNDGADGIVLGKHLPPEEFC